MLTIVLDVDVPQAHSGSVEGAVIVSIDVDSGVELLFEAPQNFVANLRVKGLAHHVNLAAMIRVSSPLSAEMSLPQSLLLTSKY